jgi:hypothetical protein
MAGRKRFLGFGTISLAACALAAGTASAAADVRPGELRVGSAAFSPPRSWPVHDLRADTQRCARLDRRAVYVGHQSRTARCPATASGAAAAIHVEPLDGIAINGRVFRRATTRIAGRRVRLAIQGPAAGTVVAALPALGVLVTVPADDRVLVRRVFRSFRFAGRVRPTPVTLPVRPPDKRPELAPFQSRAKLGTFGGSGFDTCAAPSLQAMQAWLASPYRAVGIYIGGVNRACQQPNLSQAWVGEVQEAGWVLIPTYVGLQAPCSTIGGAAKIDPATAATQGAQAADDAIAQAKAIGLAPNDPVYFDMEHFDSSDAGCVNAVKTFLEGWTKQLKAQGWTAGVYGSASSTGKVLVESIGTGYTQPDALWYANWDGRHTTSGDPYVPDGAFTNHQRIHQYLGGHNETYNGVTINIDSNAVDGPVVQPAPPYAYEVASIEPFANEALTIPARLDFVYSGHDIWIRVVARNTGARAWQREGTNAVRLGTWPQERTSPFAGAGWPFPNRPGVLEEESVQSGGTGTFVARLRVPEDAASYEEQLNLVAEQLTWMNPDPKLRLALQLAPYGWQPLGMKAYWGQRKTRKDPAARRTLRPGQVAHILIRTRNVGGTTWKTKGPDAVVLGTWPAGRKSRFAARGGLSRRTPARLRHATGPRGEGRFLLTLRAPRKAGSYKERFNLRAGKNWMLDPGLTLRLRVKGSRSRGRSKPPNVKRPTAIPNPNRGPQLGAGERLEPGQFLTSGNGQYRFAMQADGNAVLYTRDGRPMFSTETEGNPGAYAEMQRDGVLAVRTAADKPPLWATPTAGAGGAVLKLEDTGNLGVLAGNAPLWTSGTVNSGLGAGETLKPGEFLTSPHGQYALRMQADGNLALYTEAGRRLWESDTDGHGGAYAEVQASDGNLVVYSPERQPLWSSGVAGYPGATVALQDDGNLVAYAGGRAIWASGTVNGGLGPDERLNGGEYISSPDGEYRLEMQTDGNLVLTAKDKQALWATGTNGNPGAYVVMQRSDGNLVVYNPANAPIWASNTAGNPDAGLAVQGDGNVVIYASNRAIWASGTSRTHATQASSVAEQAAREAEARVGQVTTTENPNAGWWSGYCEAFVALVYGNRFRFSSALNHYYHARNSGQIRGGTPPRGAIAFYGGAQGYGHVGIGVGGGDIVSTLGFPNQRLPVSRNRYTYFPQYLGWAMPY